MKSALRRENFKGVELNRILKFCIPIIFLTIFFYLPLFNITKTAFFSESNKFTFDNFYTIFTKPYTLKVLSFTFKQAFISALFTLIIGFPGAYIISHYDFKGKGFLVSLTTVPFVLPSVLVALGFITLFGTNGFVNQILMGVFHLSHPISLLYSFTGIILVHVFYNFPIVVRIIGADWEGISEEYKFAAESMGASRLAVFTKVIVPLLLPAIVASFSLVFVFCFLSFVIILTIGGARFATIEVSIYTYYNMFSDFKMGSALALFQGVFSLLFMYVYLWSGNLIKKGTLKRGIAKKKNIVKNKKTLSLSLTYLIFVVILIIAPIAVIFISAFRNPLTGAFTLSNFAGLMSSKYNYITGVLPIHVIGNSLIFACITVICSLVFALLVAYGLRGKFVGKNILLTLFMLPLAISPITIALSYIISFQGHPALLNSWIIIPIAHTLIALPFTVRALLPMIETTSASYVFVAESLGMSRLKAFFLVDLNLIRPALIAAAVFSFAISMGEFGAAYMLYKPFFTTMPIALFRFLSGRHFGIASAMGALLALASLVAFILIDKLKKEVPMI